MMTGGDEGRQVRNPKSRIVGQRARKLGFQNTMLQDMRNLYECGVQDNGEVNVEISMRIHEHESERTWCTQFRGRGMYAAQLEAWLKHFDEEQILVVPLSELKTYDGVQKQMSRVFTHIGLRPVTVADSSHKNKRHYKPMSEDEARPLRKFYKNHDLNAVRFHKAMKRRLLVSAIEKWK